MKKIQVIFCSDFLFQVIQVLPETSLDEAWDTANKLFEEHPEIGEAYDVMSFDTFKEMESWTIEQSLDNQKVIEQVKKLRDERVHKEHCSKDACKYGDHDCPVEKKDANSDMAEHCTTEVNLCNNCGFNMGVSYENCGGAEDGTCPECGYTGETDSKEVNVQSYDDDKGAAWKLMSGDEIVEDDFDSTADAEMWARDNGYTIVSLEPVEWNVPVCRTGWGSRNITVQACSEQEAIALAIDDAGSESFSENDAEYAAPDGAHKL